MRTAKCAAVCAVILFFVWGCAVDGPGPVVPPPPPPPPPAAPRVPVGIMWASGASGAMVEDTVPLVVFYHDSVNEPIGAPRPVVAWSSSNPSVLQILSDTLAVARDTGAAVLTATTATAPIDTLHVAFQVIPRWQGRLVWARQASDSTQPAMAVLEFPGHQIRQLPDLGYPGEASGDPYLTADGRRVAATAPRPTSPVANRTIYVVDLVTGIKTAPLDALPGDQFGAVWWPGDTLIAFLAGASTGYEVFTAQPDGSDVQQRTQLGQSVPPFFDATREGNLLLPLRTGSNSFDLFETTLAGDTIRRLTSSPEYEGSVAVSPDGATVAYVTTDGDFSHVWLRDRDGSNARRLLPDRRRLSESPPYLPITPATSHSPSWTLDSRFVLLAWTGDPHLRADGESYDSGSEIYAIRLTDGLAIRLTRWPRIDGQPFFR